MSNIIPYESAKSAWWTNPNNKGKPLPEYLKSEEAYNAYMRSVAPSTATQPSPTEILKNPDMYEGSTGTSSDPSAGKYFIYRDPDTGAVEYVTSRDLNDDPADLMFDGYTVKGLTGIANSYSDGKFYFNPKSDSADAVYTQLISELDALGLGEYWDSLSNPEKKALISGNTYLDYEDDSFGNLWGLGNNSAAFDIEKLLNDLSVLNGISYPEAPPKVEDYIPDSNTVYSEVDSELNPLYTQLEQNLKDAYDTQMQAYADSESQITSQLTDLYRTYSNQLDTSNTLYNNAVNNILSQQHIANVGAYDALRSDLRKSRQSALEAGASAGVRIASNVNAMLSAQNKQSATALETSNQLAQMLLQQRQANMGLQNSYLSGTSALQSERRGLNQARADATSGYQQSRSDLLLDKRTRRNTEYADKSAAYHSDYDRAYSIWDQNSTSANSAYAAAKSNGNPFADSHQYWQQQNWYK